MRLAPERIAEVEAFKGKELLDRDHWRASNLFAHPGALPATTAWSATVKIDEIIPSSYLCVAVHGEHGIEGCYAALRRNGKLVGSPGRAPSYPVNPWEFPVRKLATGYTYFFPLDDSTTGRGSGSKATGKCRLRPAALGRSFPCLWSITAASRPTNPENSDSFLLGFRHLTGHGHEAHRQDAFLLHLAVLLFQQHQFLAQAVAHRDDHAAAFPELGDQWFRHPFG